MNQEPRHSMIIQWSEEDGVYIVPFPEWEAAGHIAHHHGTTYEGPVSQGREALELPIESATVIGTELLLLRTFPAHQAV